MLNRYFNSKIKKVKIKQTIRKKKETPFYKARHVVFTIKMDGYPYEKFKKIYEVNKETIRYLIVGHEISKTGYKHYQCYIQLFDQIRIKGFQSLIRTKQICMFNQFGTNKEARNYCWKGQFEAKGTEYPQPSSITHIFGRWCEGQGERTEMLDIKELIDEGAEPYDIVQQERFFKSYGRYHAFYDKYKCMADDRRLNIIRKPIDTYVIYGDGGTGKTQSIYVKYGCANCFSLQDPKGDNKNWNGYTNQKILIIDDFYSWIPFNEMLRILDNKPYRVRKLGSYAWAQWEKVYITSNCSPFTWYENIQENPIMKKSFSAFLSRIKKCLKVSRGNSRTLLTEFKKLTDIDRHNYKEYLSLDIFDD